MTEKGRAYADLIAAELRAELDRKSTTDNRAATVVTTSGAVVAILAAIGGFLGGRDSFALPWYASLLVLLALVAFALAAFAGIIAGRPVNYAVTSIPSMEQMTGQRWGDDEDFARMAVARNRIKLIARLRQVNDTKGSWLHASWWCQTAALILLAAVVGIALAAR